MVKKSKLVEWYVIHTYAGYETKSNKTWKCVFFNNMEDYVTV